MSSHPQMPFFFYFSGVSKTTKGFKGRVSYSQQELCSCYPELWGNALPSKKTPKPQTRSQRHHTETTFCDRALRYSVALLPQSCLLLLAFFFFSLGTRCTEGTRISTRQHFSYKQYRINNHRAAVPVGRDSTKCWHIYLCS